MKQERITISQDDLTSKHVEQRLADLDQLRNTREHYETAKVVTPTKPKRDWQWIYRPFVYLAIAGLLGGLLGWTVGIALDARPDLPAQARTKLNDLESIETARQQGRLTDEDAQKSRERIMRNGRSNPYFAVEIDRSLTDDQRAGRMRDLVRREKFEQFNLDLWTFAIAGALIALGLASAERVMERNARGAAINGAIGALAGLIGGLLAGYIALPIHNAILGEADELFSIPRKMLVDASVFGLLGAFIGLAPGVVMRSGRRIAIGVAGGLVGGLVGGALVTPISSSLGLEHAAQARGLALLGVGALTGLAWGLLESTTKSGWLHVKEGLIAGKQFILYRDPTFIGSAPMSHVYLFRDPVVGRRHAAIHRTPIGFEVENLPMGGPTLVNDRPVTRSRLASGDQIRIGKTVLIFERKAELRKRA